MFCNTWVMWNSEEEYQTWRNGHSDSEYETIATVDNGKERMEYEICDGKILTIEMVLSEDETGWETVDEYLDSEIIWRNGTLSDMLHWLIDQINGDYYKKH